METESKGMETLDNVREYGGGKWCRTTEKVKKVQRNSFERAAIKEKEKARREEQIRSKYMKEQEREYSCAKRRNPE